MRSPCRKVALAFALAALVGCGGNVVVDGTGGAGGAGGSAPVGSATSSNATGPFASSAVGSSNDASMSASSSTGVSSTSTGGSVCDNNPQGCGESTGGGCLQCALDGPCSAEWAACLMSEEFTQFNDCAQQCPDQSCIDACAMRFPEGQRLYAELIDCMLCRACLLDCSSLGADCF